jgi:hypothetical protein
MSFAEKLVAAVKTAEAGTDTETGKAFRAVLEQFVDTLRGPLGVGARLDRRSDPRRLGVSIYPEHRPSQGSVLLSFFLDGDVIVAPGTPPDRLSTPEKLEEWLLNYVQAPTFIESLTFLREQATEPVEAQLQVNADARRHKQDMTVAVTAEQQQILGNLSIGAPVTLEVERIEFPGNPATLDPPSYARLVSAGIAVDVLSCAPAGAKVSVSGKRI